jgi:superfamily II DNA or RNA helicase
VTSFTCIHTNGVYQQYKGNICNRAFKCGSELPEYVALILRNGGSQSPDRWLRELRNNHKPAFVSNNPEEGKKVISVIEDELMKCDQFQISVAFITMGGITPLLQTLKELEKRQIPGQILTTNYLNFSEPRALKKLQELSNVTLKMYDVDRADQGFHTKGYIFKKEEIYRIIIGSSNITSAALTKNKEWNTKIVSTEQGEIAMEIVKEFHQLWDSKYALFYDDFYENYKQKYEIIKKQREIAKLDEISSTEKYKLEPNSMQVGFITNLRRIVDAGENRALLISATGTGKTYASAFAMRELGFKRVLFLVHRSTLAKQALTSFRKVFEDKKSMGIVGSGYSDYEADYIFAMVETLHKADNLRKFDPEEFDCIVLDEAHHSPANTYQKVMEYFKPKLFLGMTATPDKRDDGDASRNVYELFHYQIAYEIRLQQAMEEDLLCPFHYFGISDISMITDEQAKARNISEEYFGRLTGDERVRHVIEQAKYYGYSGDRVKGLIFCSRNRECEELSAKFNRLGYRTVALSGKNTDRERETAFERLAMNEEDATDEMQPLDYIFSVDILNEGVDIVEVNQVIMLRPTQSPIVFIQQLGRGLRKAENKEYVVILDFIGNYNNNFMIPVALSGDRTYNADTIRKYVISGNNTIHGASTVHFDEIAKEKIFNSIDKIRGMKSIIRESYISLKNRIGRIPLLYDFYEQGEIDPLVIIKEYKTYWQFMEAVETGKDSCKLNDQEKLILEYLSKTILSGVRPSELCILKEFLDKDTISTIDVRRELEYEYDYFITDQEVEESVKVLQGHFVSKDDEYQKYKFMNILRPDGERTMRSVEAYQRCLQNEEFNAQIRDIIKVGLARYKDKYTKGKSEDTPFVLYEKYSRRDVSLLMNCGKDLSSTMYGMSRIGDDVFIFITYHKEEAEEGKNYADGKPDYADAFEDNLIFKWDSQIGKDNSSPYMQKVLTAPRKHLLVKKSDAETGFYYMGQFDIVESADSQKEDNNGKMKPIAKVTMKMHHPVREDLLRYLQSNISKENEAV